MFVNLQEKYVGCGCKRVGCIVVWRWRGVRPDYLFTVRDN